MTGTDKPILIYATFPSISVARTIGTNLVERRLAACVNIIPGMHSIYRWDAQIETSEEVVGIVKTRSGLADAVIAQIRASHPYDNPAILCLNVTGGSTEFINWILASTGPMLATGD
jgi:periplasmic divalent cation tolerance protein